jgi:Fe-S-cluster-containing dehydrogenase component
MKKVLMIVDIAKCVGCFNCMVACKDEHVGNKWLPYTDEQMRHEQKWIDPLRFERGAAPYTEIGFITKVCMHCTDAPCQKKAPGAISQRGDGIVLLDVSEAAGHKELTEACPYGNISWNSEISAAQKCTMCAHLLDSGWTEPRCVQACPLRALSIMSVTDEEYDEIVKNQCLEPLDGSIENRPRVLYKNLGKARHKFIVGALITEKDGIREAASGAKVKLMLNGVTLAEIESDDFGEFKFDHIPAGSGSFEIECSYNDCKNIIVKAVVEDESVCLPDTVMK